MCEHFFNAEVSEKFALNEVAINFVLMKLSQLDTKRRRLTEIYYKFYFRRFSLNNYSRFE